MLFSGAFGAFWGRQTLVACRLSPESYTPRCDFAGRLGVCLPPSLCGSPKSALVAETWRVASVSAGRPVVGESPEPQTSGSHPTARESPGDGRRPAEKGRVAREGKKAPPRRVLAAGVGGSWLLVRGSVFRFVLLDELLECGAQSFVKFVARGECCDRVAV